METQPPRLAGQFAALRATTATTPKGAWIPAPVHALIMACLARIFGRLEQLVLLWQAGNLPTPATRPTSTPRPLDIRCAAKDSRFLPHPPKHHPEHAARQTRPTPPARAEPSPARHPLRAPRTPCPTAALAPPDPIHDAQRCGIGIPAAPVDRRILRDPSREQWRMPRRTGVRPSR